MLRNQRINQIAIKARKTRERIRKNRDIIESVWQITLDDYPRLHVLLETGNATRALIRLVNVVGRKQDAAL